jgi:hypothetical protein
MKNVICALGNSPICGVPKRRLPTYVHLDAFVGEERGKAHLISAAGGDSEIGALAAAFANGDPFRVIDPGR